MNNRLEIPEITKWILNLVPGDLPGSCAAQDPGATCDVAGGPRFMLEALRHLGLRFG